MGPSRNGTIRAAACGGAPSITRVCRRQISMLQQYNVTRKVLQHIDTVTTHFQRGDVSALNSAIAAWTPGNTARAPAPARAHALFWVENTPTEHRHRCYSQCCYLCNQRANELKHVTRLLRSRGRIRRAVEAARPGPSLHFVHGFGLGSHSQLLLPDVSVGELYLYRVRTAKQIGRPAPRAEVDPQVSAVGPALHGPLLAILVGPGNRHELARL